MEDEIEKAGKAIDSPEAEKRIEIAGKGVDDLAAEMEEKTEKEGSFCNNFPQSYFEGYTIANDGF